MEHKSPAEKPDSRHEDERIRRLILLSAWARVIESLPKTLSIALISFFTWLTISSQKQPFKVALDLIADIQGDTRITLVFQQELLVVILTFLIFANILLFAAFYRERKLRRSDIKRFGV